MPATAGRVRMPANNRVHSSAALQTHDIWQTFLIDPYAPAAKEDGKKAAASVEPVAGNAYNSFQGLLTLARISKSNSDEVPGSCSKCGRVGHLTYQCRNFLSVNDDVKREGRVDDAVLRDVVLEKSKGEKVKGGLENGESCKEGKDDSDSLDSDYVSEMERVIAEKFGKKFNGRAKVGSRRKAEENDDDEDEKIGGGRRGGRSKKRRSSSRKRKHTDSEDEEWRRRAKRKKGRRKRSDDESSDDTDSEDEERRRRGKRKERRKRDDDESSDEENKLKRRKKRKSRRERRRRRSHRHSSDDSDSSSEDSGDRRHRMRLFNVRF